MAVLIAYEFSRINVILGRIEFQYSAVRKCVDWCASYSRSRPAIPRHNDSDDCFLIDKAWNPRWYFIIQIFFSTAVGVFPEATLNRAERSAQHIADGTKKKKKWLQLGFFFHHVHRNSPELCVCVPNEHMNMWINVFSYAQKVHFKYVSECFTRRLE